MVCPSQGELSISELSAWNDIPKGHLFVLLKGYFDGGNKPDSRQYDTATLAFIAGERGVLSEFERAWKSLCKIHHADFLHTTDAVVRINHYDGWGEDQRDAFIQGCATLMAGSILREEHGRRINGIVPATVTINLKDFKRVQAELPNAPRDATEILATQAFGKLIEAGQFLHTHFWELFFDRNEPYRGHVVDRTRNPKFVKFMSENGIDIERRFVVGPELDMRDFPALQAADLLAWSVGQNGAARFPWQQTVLDMTREKEVLEYDVLRSPEPITMNFVKYCKFPKRAATK